MESAPLRDFYNQKYPVGTAAPPPSVRQTRWPSDRYEAVLAAIPPIHGDRYLEIGAGDGRIAIAVRQDFGQLTLTDLSEGRVLALQEIFSQDFKVACMIQDIERDWQTLGTESYDVVVMNAIVEHLVEPIRVLQAVRQSLRPGGCLILTTPNIAKWTRRTKLLFGRFPGTSALDEGLLCYDRKTPTTLYDEGHLHYFSFRSLTRVLVERAGFSAVERFSFGRPALLARIIPTLFGDCCVRATR